MESKLPAELEAREIPDHLVLETSRVLVLKKGINGRYKALFCENSDGQSPRGKSSEKRSKYEIPGGKIFDTANKKKKNFNQAPEVKKEKIRIETAVRELEEETGVYINSRRLIKISTEFTELTGDPHPDFPIATHRKTNIYVAILDENEYKELPKITAASFDNDDRHKGVDWHENFETTDLSSSDLDGLISRNSKISLQAAEKINDIADDITQRVEEQVFTLAQEQNTALSEQGLSAVQYSKLRKAGTDKISSVDFNGNQPLSEEDFYKSFNLQFGLELTANSLESFVKKVLLLYCKPYLIERSLFLGEHSTHMLPREYSSKIGNYVEIITTRIKKPKDFYNFYRKSNNTPFGRRLLRSFFGYGKISQLDYFSHIVANEEDFKTQLANSITEKDPQSKQAQKDERGRYAIKLPTHGRKCFLELDSGVKTLSRMASKSTTKVDVDPHDIKDVYRARIVVQNEEDISEIVILLTQRLGNKNSPNPKSWKLEQDLDPETNINRDKNREETKVKGRYPVEGTSGIPIEFMIMTEANYQRNESGSNHHNVYLAIQTLVEDSRPTDKISKESMETIIQRLTNDPSVLQSYPNYSEKNRSRYAEQASKDIRERFNDYFFEHSGAFYAYQHIHRVRNASILARQEDEIFLGMTRDLNQKIGCILTAQEWKQLFDNPSDFPIEKLLKKIGFSLPQFLKIVGQLKWDTDINTTAIFGRIHYYIQSRNSEDFVVNFVFKALHEGVENLDKGDLRKIKRFENILKDITEDFHEKVSFLQFLDSL